MLNRYNVLILLSLLGQEVQSKTQEDNESIVQIDSFHEVDFNDIEPGSLVVFDVDDTLIQPTDTLLVNAHLPEAQELLKEFGVASDKSLKNIIAKEAQRPLIEPFIIDEIRKLQARTIPVIACTAIKTGPNFAYEIWESLEEWRYNHLKSLGFKGQYDDKIISLPCVEGRLPVFHRGILATDLIPKGTVIGQFLDFVDLHPSTIIMFDDNLSFLLSVKKECAKRNIKFKGYQYCGANKTSKKAWNEPLVRFQLEHLFHHGLWLNDDAARSLMNDNEARSLMTELKPTEGQ